MGLVSEIRPSPIAGTWYEGNPDRLAQKIDRYLNTANIPDLAGEVIAVIAPHAGHRYSGRTAGHAFRTIQGQRRDLVIVVSPMHNPTAAQLLTTAHQAYSTPLGNIWVDQDALTSLTGFLLADNLSLIPIPNDREHSLEIELPFLQRALTGEFRLLPLMVHSQSPWISQCVGKALAQTVRATQAQGKTALLVGSTDLSHFYSLRMAERLDQTMLNQIAAFDPAAMFQVEAEGKGFACGLGAVTAVLWAARDLGANAIEILHHSTSAEETGDETSVVGYGAAVALKRT
ncbi:MAG TPA: AmmeMemoRadiSam system protein B [Anaerolineaceae bacterium]